MNSIFWKGVRSTTIPGLLICELPPISKPRMRTKETIIDGRDGSIIEELGYESYTKTITIGLSSVFDINEVIKYFTGEGELVFSNEIDKVYRARITEGIDFERLIRFKRASVKFLCQPFKYKRDEVFTEAEVATASGTNIILNDCANAPMRIETEAESVIVHGKNLVNANAFALSNNTSFEALENGYKMIAVGGKDGTYTASRYNLPLSMRGKTYCLKCDEFTFTESQNVTVQVVMISPSQTNYSGITPINKTTVFTVPEGVTSLTLGIWTNNTATMLEKYNTVTVSGVMLTPIEFKNDAWTPFVTLQEATVEDGAVLINGNSPITVISNAENAEMKATYFKNYEVFNEGLESSRPLMVLKGSGTVEISVNGTGIFSYTFPEGENEVVIDSEKEDAYLGSVLKNRNMNGEFPVLLPKTNIIGWSGDVESIEILPRSRWL